MSDKPNDKSFGIPLPSDFSQEGPPEVQVPVPPKRNPPEGAAGQEKPAANETNQAELLKFRTLLRDGYRYLLQTSAIANQVDVPKNVAFFVSQVQDLKPGAQLDLEPLHDHLTGQGIEHEQSKELLLFFRSKQSRFNVTMKTPLSFQKQDTEAIAQILAGTSAKSTTSSPSKKKIRSKAKAPTAKSGLPLTRMPKAYTDEDVVPGSTDYLKDLGLDPTAKFEISKEGKPLLDRESQEGEPVSNALLNPSLAPQSAKARGGSKAPNKKRPTKTGPKQGKKKSKSKKKRAARDNLDTGLLAPMGLGFLSALIPVMLLGKFAYRENAGDPIEGARYAVLLTSAVACYGLLYRKNPLNFFKNLGFSIAPFWTVLGIGAGAGISYTAGLASVENVGAYVFSGFIGTVFTVIFFGGFLAAAIAEVDDSPMVPGFLTAVVFGFYTLSYPWLRNLEGMALWYWVANMTIFVGFPMGFLMGRTRSIIPPFFFYLAISIAPGILPLFGIK